MIKPSRTQADLLEKLICENSHLSVYIDSGDNVREVELVDDAMNRTPLNRVPVDMMYKQGWLTTSEVGGVTALIPSALGREALDSLTEEDRQPPEPPPLFETHEVLEALKQKYRKLQPSGGGPPKYLYFDELPERFGHEGRRIDFWALNCWNDSLESTAYEIKVSRNDFLNELKHPEKRQFGLDVSNYFYFLAPPGVILAEEVPDECGLMFLMPNGRFNEIKKAPFREKNDPEWSFFASFALNLFRNGG